MLLKSRICNVKIYITIKYKKSRKRKPGSVKAELEILLWTNDFLFKNFWSTSLPSKEPRSNDTQEIISRYTQCQWNNLGLAEENNWFQAQGRASTK